MNLQLGSNVFRDVTIPVLWGKRALIQDEQSRLSIIDLAGDRALLEVLGDEPAPGIEFRPTSDGFLVIRNGETLYKFNPGQKILSGVSLDLPDVQINAYETRVGTNIFSGNSVSGMAIGIAIGEQGISFGVSQLPEGLADLVI